MLAFLVRRLFFAAIVLVAVAAIVYGMFGDLGDRMVRVFFHFDFGDACSHPGCPPVRELWARTWTADLYLLIGGLAIGVLAGIAGAVFCATRPRSLATRAVEAAGTLFYSLPVYLFGFGILLLFEPTFGALPLPYFFHPLDYEAPLEDPWAFVRSMVVPWIVVAAPLAAIVLRLTQAAILETIEAEYVRTAEAKGLSRRRVIRRHAAPAAYVSVASLIGVWVPTFVTNMVLVEYVFFVPGFFAQTKRALGQVPELPPGYDIPMLQALAVWAAAIIVVVSALVDLVVVRRDPRVRATGRPVDA